MPTQPEPSYHTVANYRGSPFSKGDPLPYPESSALYRALAIFRDCKDPITKTRFIVLGGRAEDLDRLLAEGKVVQFRST